MRKRLLVLFVLLGTVVTLAVTAVAGAIGGGTRLFTELTGAAEVPGPGDPDGEGFAKIAINTQTSEVCWRIRVKGITLPATAAHIHVGPVGVAGPVVVGLGAPDQFGKSVGCITADPAVAAGIADNPDEYYVNVHNADFPAGAVRGQLG